jgi:Lon protease-like protein
MSTSYAPGTVIEDLALFPLPQVVFFPHTLLPLHVFEPRYRTMTERVLAGTKQLAVVLITEPRRIDAQGHPPIAKIATVGEVVRSNRLADGRYNLALEGKARVTLEELPFEPPFRRARAVVLGPTDTTVPDTDVAALVSAATRFSSRVRSGGKPELQLPATYQPGPLADA